MRAFDTDILTEILAGNPAYAERIGQVPADQQAVSIVVVEEIVRGRLNVIRQAEAGKAKIPLEEAYRLFEQTLADLRELRILPHVLAADMLVKTWRNAKVKGSSHDLRIAASCVTHSATLITRNRRDFEKVPGLAVEFWD